MKVLCNWGPELMISSFTATAWLSNHIHHKHASIAHTVLSLSVPTKTDFNTCISLQRIPPTLDVTEAL